MEENKNLGAENKNTEPKTYTEEEVQKMMQVEGDRRVTEALKKAEKRTEAKIEEAKRLAVMNESEKYEYELKKKQQLLEEREEKLTLLENKQIAINKFAELKIPVEMADLVVDKDKDKMNNKIEALTKSFRKCVKEEVERRIANPNPKNGSSSAEITREQFSKMTIKQQAELLKNQPELYKSLTT